MELTGDNIKKVTVGGVEYTLQKIPFQSYLELVDRTTSGVKTDRVAWAQAMYEHVVVDPKVTMEDFDDDIYSGLQLVNECESFLTQKIEQPSKQPKKTG